MNQIQSKFFADTDRHTSLDIIDRAMNHLQMNSIATAPWAAYAYKPQVKFSVAHGKDCILIKYWVKENNVQAVYTNTNDPVYRDSCVEFFIALEPGDDYYNFEFNYMGTCLAGFGKGKEDRTLLPVKVIDQIRKKSTIPTNKPGLLISWELLLVIPFDVFYFHTLESLKGKTVMANFYKCGDDLPEPHYLVWSNIQSEIPDFHLPAFFGQMKFI